MKKTRWFPKRLPRWMPYLGWAAIFLCVVFFSVLHILQLVQKIGSGHGLDTFFTAHGHESNAVMNLIILIIALPLFLFYAVKGMLHRTRRERHHGERERD